VALKYHHKRQSHLQPAVAGSQKGTRKTT